MNYLLNKLKLIATGAIMLSFFMIATLSSCDIKSNSSDADTDVVEVEVVEEHPAGDEEQPAGDEEHPSDSTASEHPEGDDS